MTAIGRQPAWERAAIAIAIAGIAIAVGFVSGMREGFDPKAMSLGATLFLLLGVAAWRRIKPAEIGLRSAGVLLAVPFVAALFAAGILADIWRPEIGTADVWKMVLGCGLVGFTEELLWRGYLQTEAVRSFGYLRGLLLASILFGILHLPKTALAGHSRGGAVALQTALHVLMGVVFGHCYRKAGSLWAPAALHALVNSAGLFTSIT